MNRWGHLCTSTKWDSIQQGVEGDLFKTTPKLHVQASITWAILASDAHPKCLNKKRQDHARNSLDEKGHTRTMKCRLDQHLHCCLPGMHSSRDFRSALSMGRAWVAPGISYRPCVGWVKQMQVDCNAVAGCPSNNPARWKLWDWKTARDVAEECWSQGAQRLSAQPILLKCPGGLVLTHFRPPEKSFPPQERSHFHVSLWALPSLDTPHYADCQGGGKNPFSIFSGWRKGWFLICSS